MIRRYFLLLLGIALVIGLLSVFFIDGPVKNTFRSFGKPSKEILAVQDAFNRNDLDGALAQADALLAKDPKNADVLIQKSLILAQKGSLQFKEEEYGKQAAEVAEQATKLKPKNSEAWRALAYSYEIRQNYPKAHEYYQKAIALDPKNTAALFGDAHSYDLEGDIANAEKGYRAAIALNPNFDQAHMGLGRILFANGDKNAALAEFKQAYELASNTHNKADAASSISSSYLDLTDRIAALAYAKEATILDPNYSFAWYMLGRVYTQMTIAKTPDSADQRLEYIQQALAAERRAIELNPNQSAAYFELGWLQVNFFGDKKFAIDTLKQGIEAVPGDITLNKQDKARILMLLQDTLASAEKK